MDPHQRKLAELQKNSSDLVVFSRLAERVVTISWPTHNNVKIVPSGIKGFLRNRGLLIECFCAFLSEHDDPKSCQIVVSRVTNDVFLFCHYPSARCAFKVNLTRVHDKCLLKSSYPNLPLLRCFECRLSDDSATGKAPDTDTLLVAFTLHNFPDDDMAPHFEGYFGEHISGTLLLQHVKPRANTNRRRQSSPYARQELQAPRSNAQYLEIDDLPRRHREVVTAPARIRAASNAAAGPSRISVDSASARRPAPFPLRLGSDEPEATEGKEARYLRQLLSGRGIPADAVDGLMEDCSECGQYFTASALKAHIKKCLGELVVL
ncbi:hypothetical protein DFH06DRAFT_1140647 [Mycena polygramma]|nr:hypothetical protein DFH06DRAFT_1140647 [Mycena polygramma]